MATTREQSEAYGYANRRMSTSLLRGTDEARFDPRRRLNRGLGAGVAIGVVIMAGFGIAGWLGGGRGPALPQDGPVAVGDSSFVVVDGVVHPALNLSSALLAGGGDLTEVREGTLNDAPRGPLIGIRDAPDELPDADDLLDGDWTMCATPSEAGGDPVPTALYVSVEDMPTGSDESGGATVFVETEDGRLWLLTEGRRYEVDPAVRGRLGLPQDPVPLPSEIIATVPEGPMIKVPYTGSETGEEPSFELASAEDAVVGDIAYNYADGASDQYFLVRPNGLAPISELDYRLLSSELSTSHRITLADIADAPDSDYDVGEEAWPAAVSEVQDPERGQPVCVTTPPGSEPGDAPWQATVQLPQTMPAPEGMLAVQSSNGRMGAFDEIYLPPGSGALVRAATSGGAGGTYTLITDSGMRYPIASAEAVQSLGYDPAAAPSMPTAYVNLLPKGPVLDPEDAAQEREGESE